MKFPSKRYTTSYEFMKDYFKEYSRASKTVDQESIESVASIFKETMKAQGVIYFCGNGHSAAISSAFESDYVKCIRSNTSMMPNIRSLASNSSLITCLANDISYDEIFAYQIESMARQGDILVTISSSGNSENVVRAAKAAKEKGITCISMTGFDGGRTSEICDINVHVQSQNYGVIEDLHQSILHAVGQFLRQEEFSDEEIQSIYL